MFYSKALNVDDYHLFPDQSVEYQRMLGQCNALMNHQHRQWEYCMGLKAMDDSALEIDTVADVGGGGALLAPILFRRGLDVTVIDPDTDAAQRVLEQNISLQSSIKCMNMDFLRLRDELVYDAVFAVSVIEHVDNDYRFFMDLFRHSRKFVYLTTDFSRDGERYSPDHLRTYTDGHLLNWIELLPDNWDLLGTHDWSWQGNNIFNKYNFVSFCAVNKDLMPDETV